MSERRSHPSLDEVLKDISRGRPESFAATPMHGMSAEADAQVMHLLGTIQRAEAHHQPQGSSLLAESGLKPRQRALPMLTLRNFGSLAAMFILVAGVGAATVLTQMPQDVRQQASDGRLSSPRPRTASPSPNEIAYEPAQQGTADELSPAPGRSPTVWIGGFFIALSVVVLLGLFVWLFAV